MANVGRVQEVITALQRVRKKKTAAVFRGLKKAGLFVQRESQLIVPVDTGVLRNTANTRGIKHSETDVEVRVSYGTEYGIYVHEDLGANHAPGTEAKFLEKPFRQNKKRIALIVVKEIENA